MKPAAGPRKRKQQIDRDLIHRIHHHSELLRLQPARFGYRRKLSGTRLIVMSFCTVPQRIYSFITRNQSRCFSSFMYAKQQTGRRKQQQLRNVTKVLPTHASVCAENESQSTEEWDWIETWSKTVGAGPFLSIFTAGNFCTWKASLEFPLWVSLKFRWFVSDIKRL